MLFIIKVLQNQRRRSFYVALQQSSINKKNYFAQYMKNIKNKSVAFKIFECRFSRCVIEVTKDRYLLK